MRHLLTIFLILIPGINNSQITDFSEADNYVLSLKADRDIPVKDLAEKLTAPFSSDLLKTRAIFTWIAANIEYDHSKVVPGFMTSYPSDLEEAFNAFKNRKGDCRGYSQLFKYMLGESGIKCRFIRGFAGKDIKEVFPQTPNHAWNAVKINDEWHLFDVTWASGPEGKVNYTWFMTDPGIFNQNHYPLNARTYRRLFPALPPSSGLRSPALPDEALAKSVAKAGRRAKGLKM